jgi:hypothetical protein
MEVSLHPGPYYPLNCGQVIWRGSQRPTNWLSNDWIPQLANVPRITSSQGHVVKWLNRWQPLQNMTFVHIFWEATLARKRAKHHASASARSLLSVLFPRNETLSQASVRFETVSHLSHCLIGFETFSQPMRHCLNQWDTFSIMRHCLKRFTLYNI